LLSDPLLQLLTATALGLLLGLERGWHDRNIRSGGRIAGIRTFTLLAITGQLTGQLSTELTPLLAVAGLVGVMGLLGMAHWLNSDEDHDYGITTLVAGVLTYLFGLLVALDQATLAVAGAVITSLLLHFKETLHQWLERLSAPELRGILQLALISAVLLPVLPNRGFGPWQALNPYEIWLLVVLIAGISLSAYFAMRLTGPDKGVMITSALGGIASSTALTLSLAKMSRQVPLYRLLAGGILLASAIMYPRILFEVAVVNAALLKPLAVPMLAMCLASLLSALWLWKRDEKHGQVSTSALATSPFEIVPALKFGLLLAAIMLATEAVRALIGEQGLWIVSLVAGLTDVDAITLTLARLARDSVGDNTAVVGITLAALTNTLVKGILATLAGGLDLLRELWPGLLLTLLAGGGALLI